MDLKWVKRQRNLESLPIKGKILDNRETVESRVQNDRSEKTFI